MEKQYSRNSGEKKNLTLSSPPAGVTAPPLLMEGGTISGLRV